MPRDRNGDHDDAAGDASTSDASTGDASTGSAAPRDNTPDVDRQRLSTRRLEAFTDGVFAIAATLLVLDITIDAQAKITSDSELWQALGALSHNILNFAISFVLLGLLWIVHVRQFEYVIATDDTVLWLNILRLLGVALVPFATSLNNDYGDFLAGRIALPLCFLAVILLGTVQWYYASAPGRGLVAGLSPAGIASARQHGLIASVLALGVVLLSIVAGSFAFLLFALDPLIDLTRRRRLTPAAAPSPGDRSS
ncbi:hypothetical protein GCM10022381_07100 [Leifsonia kafniensis]|uniref:DUF1211 domain-containing protein n=1 Tax=Leifsonia kafniensis TaxID=475957 RepID=A0ABP7K559_9MICO